MARRCLDRFGDDDARALLRSAMLNLSPGMTQVGAALSDGLMPASESRPGGAGAQLLSCFNRCLDQAIVPR